MNTFICLLVGLFLGSCLLFFARKFGVKHEKKILAIALLIAAIIYVFFALLRGDSDWILIESIGVIAYGLVVWMAMRYSAYYLCVGWLLHPLWDVYLHLLGPGHEVAPQWYALACISFDLLVAAYVFYRIPFWKVDSKGIH